MQIELNRATFRPLVQLYIASTVISLAALSRQVILTPWLTFSSDFDELVATHFEPIERADWVIWLGLGLVILLVGWMFASMIGLLWLQP